MAIPIFILSGVVGQMTGVPPPERVLFMVLAPREEGLDCATCVGSRVLES